MKRVLTSPSSSDFTCVAALGAMRSEDFPIRPSCGYSLILFRAMSHRARSLG